MWEQLHIFHESDGSKRPGLETYFLSNSQTFASGLNLNSQITVSYSQLVLLYLLICCLRICYDKVFKRDKRRKTSQFEKYIPDKQTYADVQNVYTPEC